MRDEGEFGIRDGAAGTGEGIEDTSNYFTKYPTPSDDPEVGLIEEGETIDGELFIGELKVSKSGNVFFPVIISDHDREEKWVVSYFGPTLVLDDNVVRDAEAVDAVENESDRERLVLYGKRGGRPYVLLDELIALLFKKNKGEAKYHSVNFAKFRGAVNKNVLAVKAKMEPSTHPMANAGTLHFLEVETVEG